MKERERRKKTKKKKKNRSLKKPPPSPSLLQFPSFSLSLFLPLFPLFYLSPFLLASLSSFLFLSPFSLCFICQSRGVVDGFDLLYLLSFLLFFLLSFLPFLLDSPILAPNFFFFCSNLFFYKLKFLQYKHQ